MLRTLFSSAGVLFIVAVFATGAGAQSAPGPAAPAASASAAPLPAGGLPPLPPYERWTLDAQKQPGLFTVWRKDGRVYLELRSDQFDRDYLQTAVNANGLGGFGIVSGQFFQQEARLLRFVRDDRRVAMVWPQSRFLAAPNTPLADAVRLSTASSVLGMASIATEDKKNNLVVLDMAALLGDVMDFTATINGRIADPKDPLTQYRLDPTRSYFGPSKSFPNNVVIEADQTYAAAKPLPLVNTVVDSRSIQVRAIYNLIALPADDGYMPRLVDDRVGYFEDTHIAFDRVDGMDNLVPYVIRWNMQASDPNQALSPAKKPMVYTLSNTIPLEYRDPIRRAILTWNKAFERIGISNAVQVVDQPTDPAWDPDDVRYNVVRWLTEANSGGFASAQLLWDPRTGQILRTGVLVDHDLVHISNRSLAVLQGDQAAGHDPRHFHNDGAAMNAEMSFGAIAQSLMTGADPDAIAKKQIPDYLYAVMLHEVGHNFGLQHNFIGHTAYARDKLRDKSFTSVYGLSTSVMDYIPFNLAPRGMKNGDMFQMVLGPYDYHAIHWGYAPVPGAKTPRDELPTLNKWASAWSDPKYRFASDEDVFWAGGHAVDPRVHQFLLSSDQLGWCSEQLAIVQGLLKSLDSRFPKPQQSWQDERAAFGFTLTPYIRCSSNAAHFIGGEYLSRARVGDPHAAPPLTPVSRDDERRAFRMVDRYVFSNDAWNFSPMTLRRLVYTEHSSFSGFNYNPTLRHDLSVAELAARVQNVALGYMFAPLVLARIADLPTKAKPGATMTLSDLFTWAQRSIYGDLAPVQLKTATAVRRNLQRRYASLLATLAVAPPRGTPYDAQALARFELSDLDGRIGSALRGTNDLQARAHLEAMRVDVRRALRAQGIVPAA